MCVVMLAQRLNRVKPGAGRRCCRKCSCPRLTCLASESVDSRLVVLKARCSRGAGYGSTPKHARSWPTTQGKLLCRTCPSPNVSYRALKLMNKAAAPPGCIGNRMERGVGPGTCNKRAHLAGIIKLLLGNLGARLTLHCLRSKPCQLFAIYGCDALLFCEIAPLMSLK